ncbi:hypothetical protein MFRU_052g00350 [Monilinia fructicola]|uniref:Uncharacterized protein n=1 Tax=Monilinia fructicola TaxID=38448 RepID=A0A5M9J8S6_MONFR|nr:hypothetical protein EYC84_011677 [Monilinia fructicola]KAG4025716.1 hypothetical protein MFRU_052g00350 [Monilinia fructicola]
MAFLQPGLSLGGYKIERNVEICIPAAFVAPAPLRGYWRPEFISDYFSYRRLAVTRHLNWWINDIVSRARLEQEATRSAEGMQVVLWQDPAPIEEWIHDAVSVRPAGQADAALESSRRPAPYCGEVPGTLRPGLRPAIFSKTCICAVQSVFSSPEDFETSSVEGKDGRFGDEPPFLAPPGQESLVYRGLFLFPELDVPYMWGTEYRRARDQFLSEMYGIDLEADVF